MSKSSEPKTDSAPKRSRAASEQKILRAAAREFAARGFAGARMESIAKDAGVNKALVYRYYASKEQLFETTLKAKFAQRYAAFEQAPADLGEALVYWTQTARKDEQFFRLLKQESLTPDQPLVDEASRRAYYEDQAHDLSARAERGQLPPGLDPAMLSLALTAIVTYPAHFPRHTSVITGMPEDGPAFAERWSRFLHDLASHLSAGGDRDA